MSTTTRATALSSSAASRWFLSYLVGRRSPWPTWRPSCDVSNRTESHTRGRRNLDRVAGAPRHGRGLRFRRDAEDRRIRPRAADRTAPRRRRLFLASAYTGISPATCAALFDTVYVSLYKYFNAASGAILAGPRHLLEISITSGACSAAACIRYGPMRLWRCTISTAFPDRYARAVAAADALFVALGQHPRCQVARRPARYQCGAPARQGRRCRCATRSTARPAVSRSRRRSGLAGRRRSSVLLTNESLLRRPATQIIREFTEALG